jgi:hypothetical protein
MPSYDIPAVGSRAQVYHGNARHTSGGLTKKDLFRDRKSGRIKSKRASKAAKRNFKKMDRATKKLFKDNRF